MLENLIKILEYKKVKYILLILSILCFIACIILMQARIIDYIIVIAETILNRSLNDPVIWMEYLFGFCYGITFFCVIVWYFYVRKNFIISSLFLLLAFGVYLSAYIVIKVNFNTLEWLRFPLFAILVLVCYHFYRFRYYFDSLTRKFIYILNYFRQSKFFNTSFFVFICGSSLGILFFIYIYGTAILDFTYVDWLMSGGDLSQHYLGWRLFRNSSWYFPFGLMDNIVHPFTISMIYTDSIPFFALVFKLLSPILPEQFQYFGHFGIICFILQGGLGALIIRKIGGNTIFSILGSMFFLLSTIMIWRLYFHSSLAAHFIVLLCILLCLEKNLTVKRQVISWSFLMILSAMIHLYFVPMVIIFMFFYLLREYFLYRKIKNQCIIVGVSFISLIVTMFILGAFHFVNSGTGRLGTASANLNAFINPIGMSRFIKDMPLAGYFQYEGNSYLGLGIIVAVIYIIFLLFRKNSQSLLIIKEHKLTPYVFGVIISFLLFSFSPTITFNQCTFFTFPVPYPIEYIWSIFRSTGRFTWPVVYIIIMFCFWLIGKQFKKKALLVLSILLVIQWVDLNPWFTERGDWLKSKITWQTELPSPVWDNLSEDYKNIFFMDGYVKLNSFLKLAADNKITINDAYLARTNSSAINDNIKKENEYLLINGPRKEMLYIFKDKESAFLFKETGIYLFLIDDIIIGVHEKKDYLGNYKFLL